MSCTADAEIVAMQRAFPALDSDGLADLQERYYAGLATPAETEAVQREFAKVTRADIGRAPLAQHTPGPWNCYGQVVGPRDDSHKTIAILPDDDSPATWLDVESYGEGMPSEEQVANARLIAAAPALLAACEAAKRLLADILDNMPYIAGNYGSGPADDEARAWRNKIIDDGKSMLRSAIAAAKGGA